ncbi:MAG: hypothetical protein H0T11_04930, partial [Chthoniobacterales bacterium]|nr:hypothetical protein [Chthoniobacterales bacterium]
MHLVFRHLFTFFSAASLLLCVAACVLWLRSSFYHYDDTLSHATSEVYIEAESVGGKLYFRRTWSSASWWDAEQWTYTLEEDVVSYIPFNPAMPVQFDMLGFVIDHSRGKVDASPYVQTWIIVPSWAVVLITAVMPAVWLIRLVRRRHRAK